MKIKINQKADGFSISAVVGGAWRESDTVDYGDIAELVNPHNGLRYLASVDIGEPGEKDGAGNDLSGQAFPVSEFWAYEAKPINDDEIEFVEEEEDEPEIEPAVVTPNITQVVSTPSVKIETEPTEPNEEKEKKDVEGNS